MANNEAEERAAVDREQAANAASQSRRFTGTERRVASVPITHPDRRNAPPTTKEQEDVEKRAAQPRFGVLRPDGKPITKADGSPMTFNTKKAAQREADRVGGTVSE